MARQKKAKAPAQTASAADPPWAVAVMVIVLVLAGAIAYQPALDGPFLLDDIPSIVENPTIRDAGDIGAVLNPPGGGLTVQARPFLNASLAMNYATAETEPRGYRLTNIIIHLLNGLLLFSIVRQLVKRGRGFDPLREQASWIAFAVALLWVVHPLATTAVSYIIQRAESMMSLFYLLTAWAFLKATASKLAAPWLVLSAFACLLGMATKEVMVSAPLAVLFLDRTFIAVSWRDILARRKAYYAALFATWILLATLLLDAGFARGESTGAGRVSLADYLLTQVFAIPLYLKQLLLPTGLVFDHGVRVVGGWRVVAGGIVLLTVVVLLVVSWRKRWYALLYGAWLFAALLAPTSSLIPIQTQTIGEHRVYLAGSIILFALVSLWFLLTPHMKQPLRRYLPLAVAVIFLVLTYQRNRLFASGQAVWEDTIAKVPGNARAYYNLARAKRDAGNIVDALADYRKATEIDPQDYKAWFNLGNAEQSMRNHPAAASAYEQAIAINPAYARAHNNLAITYNALGRREDAIRALTTSLEYEPGNARRWLNRGVLQMSLARYREALHDFTQAAELEPGYAKALMLKGDMLAKLGRSNEARQAYEAAQAAGASRKDLDQRLQVLPR